MARAWDYFLAADITEAPYKTKRDFPKQPARTAVSFHEFWGKAGNETEGVVHFSKLQNHAFACQSTGVPDHGRLSAGGSLLFYNLMKQESHAHYTDHFHVYCFKL